MVRHYPVYYAVQSSMTPASPCFFSCSVHCSHSFLNAALVITNIFSYMFWSSSLSHAIRPATSTVSSASLSIVCINFFFTYPYMHLNFTMDGYPFAFLVMLIVSFVTSATTTNLKKQARIFAEREKELAAAENEKMRANLLRAISHDLRTPLTSISIGSANPYSKMAP